VLGDGTSYLIGRHYHQRLRVMWPFRKYPYMIARGVDFFHKHGGKSIILARFVGPVRPLIPAVAGMLDMPPGRFFLVNIFSALVWAPAYILPGVLFGASVGLAAEVAGRLALLLVILLALLWLSWWLVIRVARSFQAHAQSLQMVILEWSRRHPRIEPLAAALLDPQHPEARGMTVLTVLLLVASWAFLVIPQHLPTGSLLGNVDLYLYNQLQDLRSPFGDRLLVPVRMLGDGLLLYSFTGALSLWLLWKGYWRAAAHWLVTVGCVGLLTRLLKAVTEVGRPPLLNSADMSYSFPSAHASVSVAVLGFLAVIVARELPRALHWIPYSLAAFLVVAIGFSGLYLGVHWLSDILAGWSLGLAWVALMGIAYRQHAAPPVRVTFLGPLSLVALALGAGLHTSLHLESSLAFYRPSAPAPVPLALDDWLGGDWKSLPGYRDNLESQQHHPLNLQWLGRGAHITAQLAAAGWRKPRIADLKSLLELFSSKGNVESFPVLPQVHQGKTQQILLVRDLKDDDRLLALRLWRTPYRQAATGTPLWIGNVSYLGHFSSRCAKRAPPDEVAPRVRWDGRTLLVYPAGVSG
jgi:membrane-associated phospholipid phosphatase